MSKTQPCATWPLLLKDYLIRATLEGLKTQTMRVVTPLNSLKDGSSWPRKLGDRPLWNWKRAFIDPGPSPAGNDGPYWHLPQSDAQTWKYAGLGDYHGDSVHRIYPKVWTDDILWIKEAHALDQIDHNGDLIKVTYRATCNQNPPPKWKSPLHMPKKFARLKLRVVKVDAMRPLDIDEASALREGFHNRTEFLEAWDDINGPRNLGTDVNPPCWVYRWATPSGDMAAARWQRENNTDGGAPFRAAVINSTHEESP